MGLLFRGCLFPLGSGCSRSPQLLLLLLLLLAQLLLPPLLLLLLLRPPRFWHRLCHLRGRKRRLWRAVLRFRRRWALHRRGDIIGRARLGRSLRRGLAPAVELRLSLALSLRRHALCSDRLSCWLSAAAVRQGVPRVAHPTVPGACAWTRLGPTAMRRSSSRGGVRRARGCSLAPLEPQLGERCLERTVLGDLRGTAEGP
jgi:hypothetical protein